MRHFLGDQSIGNCADRHPLAVDAKDQGGRPVILPAFNSKPSPKRDESDIRGPFVVVYKDESHIRKRDQPIASLVMASDQSFHYLDWIEQRRQHQ